MAKMPPALEYLSLDAGKDVGRKFRQWLGKCPQILAGNLVSPASPLE